MLWTDFDNYVRPEHLKGKAIKAKIAEIKVEKFYNKGRSFEKPVLYFDGARRGLPLNAGNRRAIMHMFGDEAAACIGKVIELRPATDDGKTTITMAPAD